RGHHDRPLRLHGGLRDGQRRRLHDQHGLRAGGLRGHRLHDAQLHRARGLLRGGRRGARGRRVHRLRRRPRRVRGPRPPRDSSRCPAPAAARARRRPLTSPADSGRSGVGPTRPGEVTGVHAPEEITTEVPMTESTASSRAARMPTTEQRASPAQQQELPGRTAEMDRVPDHGEESYRGSGRLQGLRALITGGDSGIGRAVAIAFAREGADVALSYLPEEQQDAEETARWVREAGRTALLCPGDLTEPATCTELVGQVVADLGGLDVLVNNAGVQYARDAGLAEMGPERIERILRTNLHALLWLTQAAVPHLGEGGSIINVSSIQAYEPSTSLLDYAAT